MLESMGQVFATFFGAMFGVLIVAVTSRRVFIRAIEQAIAKGFDDSWREIVDGVLKRNLRSAEVFKSAAQDRARQEAAVAMQASLPGVAHIQWVRKNG